MIRNYFRVIRIIIEKIIIGNTQPAHDVLATSSEGPLKILTSKTYRGPSGDSQRTNTKIDDFIKNCYSEIIAEEQISKSSKLGHPRDAYGTLLRDDPGTKRWDVLETSVRRRSILFFKFNLQAH